MDYYQILRVSPNASRKEIDEAYRRLLKESRYDTTIDRAKVENAYRVLSNISSKSQYDARQTLRTKRIERTQQRFEPTELWLVAWIKKRTIPQLLTFLAIATLIALFINISHYGYLLKEFHAGDVLYDTLTDARFGKVVQVEEDHAFPTKRGPAYQIELNPDIRRYGSKQKVIWLPQDSVKQRCYKK